MEEYKKALLLRKEGKYEEGFEWLQKASEAGSLCAKQELVMVYKHGGWGVPATDDNWDYVSQLCEFVRTNNFVLAGIQWYVGKYNFPLTEQRFQGWLDASTMEGMEVIACAPIAVAYLKRHMYEEAITWLKKGATEGCALCSVRLYENIINGWDCLQFAVSQKNTDACVILFNHYLRCGNFKEAFDIYDNSSPAICNNGIIRLTKLAKKWISNKQALYFIGRSAPESYRSESVQLAREHYNIRYHRVQEAVITWLLVAKRMRLYKDVARIIGKIVFQSREQEGIWDEGTNWKKSRCKKRMKKVI